MFVPNVCCAINRPIGRELLALEGLWVKLWRCFGYIMSHISFTVIIYDTLDRFALRAKYYQIMNILF